MTKKYLYSTCFSLIVLFFIIGSVPLMGQIYPVQISGFVTEAGSNLPLRQVSVSVSSTGLTTETNENGMFTIEVPDRQAELVFYLPGYNRRFIYPYGRDSVFVALVSDQYNSLDAVYITPLGQDRIKNAVYPVTALTSEELKNSSATSFDQTFQGRVPGMLVKNQSGMPGHRTFMNIRGISSIYANTEPLLLIDGMIHDYNYANYSLMEGFALNPLDVVDIDDISNVTIMKAGNSYLGAAGSGGVININTEQQAEASTVMKFRAYGGITMAPKKLDLLNSAEFRNYFTDMLNTRGYNAQEINTQYPWLNGDAASENYYKYNNDTDWQEEIYEPSTVSKFHFFLKGGDEIATYNISTGYLSHNGIYENSAYTRYNLRINGIINISEKFSVIPNAKLSLADSKLANQGPGEWKNPILATTLKPPIMASNKRDNETGLVLDYLDDVGNVFKVSNPSAIVKNATGTNRNYHFLSSIAGKYMFSQKFYISTLVGINFNNARENIFLPNLGMVQVDSAYNSPGDFVYEFRSTQNHTHFAHSSKSASGHELFVTGGFRYMVNSYKYNLSLDLNTPSDDFKSLGQGSQYSFLRSSVGDNRGLSWVSYYGNFNYNFRNKYYLTGNISYDGNSATNKNNRYNIFPSAGAAWRLSSENFLNQANWLEDFKIRASWSETGNMFSTVYDYSKLYYTDRRMNASGVLTRESIPNENMELERKRTINAGLDLSMFRQLLNIQVDVYRSNIDNLIIFQQLPETFGFTEYYDNGGRLEISGIEISADTRIQAGSFVWTLGGNVSKQIADLKEINLLNPNSPHLVMSVNGAEYISTHGNPVNAFYGYKTNGILTAEEAAGLIGPKGMPMQAGDIRFVNNNGDNLIDENDKMVIGNPNPDFFGGFFTSIAIGNFEVSALFNYSYGNDVFNFVRYKLEAMDSYNNQSKSVLERWTPDNTNAILPRASFGDPTGNNVFSDRWLEDGSYLRLNQLTVSYDIPPIRNFLKGIGVYLTATNLVTLTGYKGYDPDFMYKNNPFFMGVDYGKMPQTQTFIAGLKLDL
jgi:TonB-linked SusC/RagA family outer membrane protein